MCASYLGTDTRPEEPTKIAAIASQAATDLCRGPGDLTAIRGDVKMLLVGDPDALVAFDAACDFDWLQHPMEFAALKSVLSTCLEALDIRIAWELTQPRA